VAYKKKCDAIKRRDEKKANEDERTGREGMGYRNGEMASEDMVSKVAIEGRKGSAN